MLGSAAMVDSDMSSELMQKAQLVCSAFEKAVENEVRRRHLPPAMFPALLPCNLLCLWDTKMLHIAFTNINAGGLPRQIWRDRRTKKSLSTREVAEAAVSELGFSNPTLLYFDVSALETSDALRQQLVDRVAKQHVEELFQAATRPRAIFGYEGLQPLLDKFLEDHTEFGKNVFLAMRFRSNKQLREIHEAAKSGLGEIRP